MLLLYLRLSNKVWDWYPVNTVCVVCVNSLCNSVLRVPAVCGVLGETKPGA